MDKFIDIFFTNIDAGNVWIGFLALAIFYVLKKEPFKIVTHFDEKKYRDIEQAKLFLDSGKLSKEANELLREYLELYVFRKFYGIRADKSMRICLQKFHQKHQADIGWHDLRRAYTFIKPDGEKFKVVIGVWAHINRWVVTIMSYLIGIYSLLLIILAISTKFDAPWQFIAVTLLSVLLLMSALAFSSMNWPYHSAIKIKSVMER